MMKLLLVSVAFLAVFSSVVAKRCKKDKMCPMPYTARMRRKMLAYHNHARSKANPTAGDMQKIYWDKTMAKMSLEHSKKCQFEHNTSPERRFNGFMTVGQNLWIGNRRPNASAPAIGWYMEKRYFTYGESTKKVVGHYTQLMQNHAARIGCGGAYCPNLKLKYLVTCNYLKGQFNYIKPYTLGKPCAACPDRCKKNLCDCKGKVCKNGGKLNLNTCKCKCLGLSHGDICQKIKCQKKDRYVCRFYKRYCPFKYGFVPRTSCPHTCGLCKK